jgi:flagellar basal body rod protein FlgC
MDSLKAMLVAVSTLRTQAQRMRDVADGLALKLAGLQDMPGYDAPIALFDAELGYDYREVYMPSHPAANERGYVPADAFVAYVAEATDAQRAYEVNLDALEEAFAAAGDEASSEGSSDDDEELVALYA